MAVLTSLGQTSGRLSRRLSRVLWPLFGACLPLALRLGLLSRPVPLPGKPPRDPDRTTFLFAIGQDNGGGRIRLRRGRLDIKWRYAAENADLVDRMTEAMARMGAEYGGSFAPLFTWLLFRRIVTVHSLGGCNLSESPETGVVSPAGEVHGYPGLFVADGSVIPTAVGFHPAMTIAAVSELIAERVAASL
jgi:cholesterol oxidase